MTHMGEQSYHVTCTDQDMRLLKTLIVAQLTQQDIHTHEKGGL